MFINYALSGVLLLSVSFAASADELRLIQRQPGLREWVSTDTVDRLSAEAHARGACGGFFDLTDNPSEPERRPATRSTLDFDADPSRPDLVLPLMARASSQRFEATIQTLASYRNRYYTGANGQKSSRWILSAFRGIAKARPDIEIQEFDHRNWPQKSVIAKIPGWDAGRGEAIVLGAHADSINTKVSQWSRSKALAPGADDNASGVAAVLEVFRVFIESGIRPARDVYFMAYAAEEVGLRGSHDIAEQFWARSIRVSAVLNLDMIVYAGPERTMGVTTSSTHSQLNNFVRKLIDRYVGVPWANRSCGFACSDHASWDRAGFPAAYVFEAVEEINPGWHRPEDVLSPVTDIEWAMNYVRLAIAFAVEMTADPTY